MLRVSLARPEIEFDPSDPEGFRAGVMRCGPALGAGRTGATYYELPPGQAVCPYHFRCQAKGAVGAGRRNHRVRQAEWPIDAAARRRCERIERSEMTEIYTVGIWTVKPGREDEFVAAWQAMGEATIDEFPAAHGNLLRDVGNPSRFISFGPWESLDAVDAWRASAPFTEGVARIRQLLDDFEPGTYEVTAEVSASNSR